MPKNRRVTATSGGRNTINLENTKDRERDARDDVSDEYMSGASGVQKTRGETPKL